MASLRRKYQERIEVSPRQDEPPVSPPPEGTAAKLPEPAADAGKPPEQPETTEAPADVAARTALKARLAEMERAEALTRQQPQHADEPQQAQQPTIPAHVEKWLTEHPQYCDPNDHVAQAEIHLATVKCMRDGKPWNDPDFIPTIERHLGIASATNEQTQHRPIERPPAAPAPRASAPPRQTVAYSAPPHREPPSMSTGRPISHRAPLSKEQLEIARASGITAEEYSRQLQKMEAMRAAGTLDDRR